MDTVRKIRAAQPLLQSVGDDGALWLFVCFSGAGWVITRNGERVESGTSSRKSLDWGVDKFVSLIHLGVNGAPLATRRDGHSQLGVNDTHALDEKVINAMLDMNHDATDTARAAGDGSSDQGSERISRDRN